MDIEWVQPHISMTVPAEDVQQEDLIMVVRNGSFSKDGKAQSTPEFMRIDSKTVNINSVRIGIGDQVYWDFAPEDLVNVLRRSDE